MKIKKIFSEQILIFSSNFDSQFTQLFDELVDVLPKLQGLFDAAFNSSLINFIKKHDYDPDEN